MGISMYKNSHFQVRLKSVFSFLIALVNGLFYALLPVELFKDRHNYLVYAEQSGELLSRYIEGGLLDVLFNEPLWLLINLLLSYAFEPSTVVRLFIFISAFTPTFLILNRVSYLYFPIFIFLSFSPYLITNHTQHIRTALAASIFILGFFLKGGALKWLLIVSSALVHVVFFPIVAIYISGYYVTQIKQTRTVAFLLAMTTVTILLYSLPFLEEVARHATRYAYDVNVGGGAFFVWSIILTGFLLTHRLLVKENIFVIVSITFFLIFYFIYPYTRRILDAIFWLVLYSATKLPKLHQSLIFTLLGIITLQDLFRRIEHPNFDL